MTAARLRAAAERLRAVEAIATPGPWQSWDESGGGVYVTATATPDNYTFGINPGLTGEYGWDKAAADADYIATMHPGVALALAAWLEDEADFSERDEREFPGAGSDIKTYGHALAVADAVLGERVVTE